MIQLAADENFDNHIVRGARLQLPALDFLRVQDVGLAGVDDEEVLAWAAAEGRLLCTHDVSTMIQHAHERVARGEPMPGLLVIASTLAVSTAIDSILLVVQCSDAEEWRDQVRFLPIR